jgi:PHD/YefM family antitoxin component YafN of YafNO toxin-antitoxin module
MPKMKSEVWTNPNGKRFVVLPEDDFERLTEMLEDAGLSRILREAKRAAAGQPTIPFAEVKRRLAAARARRRRKTPSR